MRKWPSSSVRAGDALQNLQRPDLVEPEVAAGRQEPQHEPGQRHGCNRREVALLGAEREARQRKAKQRGGCERQGGAAGVVRGHLHLRWNSGAASSRVKPSRALAARAASSAPKPHVS